MRKRFKTTRLFLKLTLLFKIYCDLCFKAEATENNLTISFHEDKVGEESNLFDQIPDKDTGLPDVAERPKRPVRLLPFKIIQ